MTQEKKKAGWKRTILEWLGIGAVIAVLYATGLHTEVLGTMQRALLWTGLFDAETSELAIIDGPTLSSADYDFSMENNGGELLSLEDYRGDVVFINVWASWCPPCVAEMPTIETLYERVEGQNNIKFILLTMDEEPQDAVNFMEEKEFKLPYHFPKSSIPQHFQSPYLPTTYVLSKEGQVIYKNEGIADYSSLNFSRWLQEKAEE